MTVGNDKTDTLTTKLMYLVIDYDQKLPDSLPSEFKTALILPDHICVFDIEFAPRKDYTLFLASVCDQKIETTRIYQVYLNLEDMKQSEITRVYSGLYSTKFKMCPTGRNLNVMDFNSGRVFSYDTLGNEEYKVVFPAKEYGIQIILDYHCDQENQIIQILGKNE